MKQAWSVFLLALIFLGYKIWSYPLIDADEPRYAEAAKEMINTNQYLIPLADGNFRFDKPILFYWFEILSFKVFGINEWAARLPSVIAGAATLGLLSWLGSFYRIGILAPVILGTSLEFFVISRMSITDATLNLFIVGSTILFYLIFEKHINEKYIYLLAVIAALGFLTKGPIAVLIPAMVGTLYVIARNFSDEAIQCRDQCIRLLRRHGLLAMTVFLLVAAPWYIAIHNATGGEFTEYFFIGQNIGRFSSTLSGHDYPWWFYLAVMLIGFLPWSLFLPSMIAGFKLKEQNARLQIFALIWLCAVTLLFSFSSTKLANYVMSIFAPLAILFALWLNDTKQKKAIAINSGFYILALLCFAWVYSQGYLDKLIASEAFVVNNLASFKFAWLLLLLVLLLVLWRSVKVDARFAMRLFTSFALVLCLLAIDYLIKPFAHYKEAGIKNFLAQLPNDTQLYLLTIDRPSVSFYSKTLTFPKRARIKKVRKKIAKGQKLCVIAKHDKAKQIAATQELKIWLEDDIYIFSCNFAKKITSNE
ncbi:MAG: glycosyltransferase family 39 protein [Candidatus Melainabacteria bacterium]|nr:glycosyltransferase family 39 protein [Candidatus Melainabacteria bacterium]